MPNASDLQDFLQTPEPAELGPGPRPGVRAAPQLQEQLGPLLRDSGLPPDRQELIRALILLWHDHLDAAHRIAQEHNTPDGAFVHGIMHRREPDFGNAAYWFRRVGRHPAYAGLSARVPPLLQDGPPSSLAARLTRDGAWDPFAFIDACAAASGTVGPQQKALCAVQRAEFETLLDSFLTV